VHPVTVYNWQSCQHAAELYHDNLKEAATAMVAKAVTMHGSAVARI